MAGLSVGYHLSSTCRDANSSETAIVAEENGCKYNLSSIASWCCSRQRIHSYATELGDDRSSLDHPAHALSRIGHANLDECSTLVLLDDTFV